MKVKQSKFQIVGKLLMCSIILGPSGSGKTVLLQNMIVDIYQNIFTKIYIFSPSINVDSSRVPVNKCKDNDMKFQHTDDDPCFAHYDSDARH